MIACCWGLFPGQPCKQLLGTLHQRTERTPLVPHQMLFTGPVHPPPRCCVGSSLLSALQCCQKVTATRSFVPRAHSPWLTDRRFRGLAPCLNSCFRVPHGFRLRLVIFWGQIFAWFLLLPWSDSSFPFSWERSFHKSPSRAPYWCYFVPFIHRRHCSSVRPQPCHQQVFLRIMIQHSLSGRLYYCSLIFGAPRAGDPPCGRIIGPCSVEPRHRCMAWFGQESVKRSDECHFWGEGLIAKSRFTILFFSSYQKTYNFPDGGFLAWVTV